MGVPELHGTLYAVLVRCSNIRGPLVGGQRVASRGGGGGDDERGWMEDKGWV